ncbi:MAG: hypothetical protein V1885_03590 [Candidatus Brennerbacteria bacterium]
MKNENPFEREERKVQENPVHERLGRTELPSEHYQVPEELKEEVRAEDDAILLEESEERQKEKRGENFVQIEELPDDSLRNLEEEILAKVDAGINGQAADEVVRLFLEGKIDIDEDILGELVAAGVISEEETRDASRNNGKHTGSKPKLPKALWEKVKEFSLPAPKWNALPSEEQERRKDEVRKAKREYFDQKLKNIVELARSGLSPSGWDLLTKQEKAKRLEDARNFYER